MRPPNANPTHPARKKIIILGGGPNRIGQGIEFDYCCCHAAFACKDANVESIMINCNPETVSTDYDTSDRLYFEPLTTEDVLEIIETERQAGEVLGLIVQFGGQTPLKLAQPLANEGAPILGTTPDAIDLAEDRKRFQAVAAQDRPQTAGEHDREERRRSRRECARDRLPGRAAALLCARRPRHGNRSRRGTTPRLREPRT